MKVVQYRKISTISVIVVFLLGVFFRLFYLYEPYWLDEANTIFYIQHSFTKLTEFVGNDFSPPLYYYFLKVWVLLFGGSFSEWVTRLLSIIFSLLSFPVMYFFGKELFSRRVGVISSLLLALSFTHIYYTWEVRMYSLVVLFALLSVLFLLRALKHGHNLDWLLYLLFTVAGTYTHYSFWFFLVGEAIAALVLMRVWRFISLRKLVWSQIIIVLAYLPWWPYFIERVYFTRLSGNVFWADFASTNIKFFLEDLVLGAVLSPFEQNFFLLLITKFVLISLFVLAIFRLSYFEKKISLSFYSNNNTYKVISVFFLFFVPFFILYVLNIYIVRYVVVALPFVLLLIAVGLSRIENRKVQVVVLGFLLFIMFLSCLSSIQILREQNSSRRWDEVADFIEQNEQSEDKETILVIAPLARRSLSLYYNGSLEIQDAFPNRLEIKGQDPELTKTRYIGIPVIESDLDIRDIAQRLGDYSSIWVVDMVQTDYVIDPDGLLKEWLNENFQKSKTELKFLSNYSADLYVTKYVRNE